MNSIMWHHMYPLYNRAAREESPARTEIKSTAMNNSVYIMDSEERLTSQEERQEERPVEKQEKLDITKERIREVIDHMLVKGAPASDKIKKDYCSRIGGLLKRGILQVLDDPKEFEKKWNQQGWTLISQLAYLKAISQWITTLQRTSMWPVFYGAEIAHAGYAVRTMTRDLNARNKLRQACTIGPVT